MKNNKLRIVLGIVLGVLILIGAAYLGRSISNKNGKVKGETDGGETLSDYSLNGNTCHNRFKHFIITRADPSGNTGDDILVKYKTDENQNIDCDYLKEDGDFELLNTPEQGPSKSQSFAYADSNILVVSEKNGLIDSLNLYNLENKEKIYADTFTADTLDLQNGILTYWRRTNDIPNKYNCSKVEEYNSMGGAKIEAKISLNIFDVAKKDINEFRCSFWKQGLE